MPSVKSFTAVYNLLNSVAVSCISAPNASTLAKLSETIVATVMYRYSATARSLSAALKAIPAAS